MLGAMSAGPTFREQTPQHTQLAQRKCALQSDASLWTACETRDLLKSVLAALEAIRQDPLGSRAPSAGIVCALLTSMYAHAGGQQTAELVQRPASSAAATGPSGDPSQQYPSIPEEQQEPDATESHSHRIMTGGSACHWVLSSCTWVHAAR